MAEGIGQGPEINSSTTQGLPGQKGPEGLPGQVVVPVERRPWSVSLGFDAARTSEYLRTEDGGYTVFTDPKTGKEVARVLKAAGGRPPEGPRGPLPPDYLWSPEFRRLGIGIAREIIYLEAELNKDKYDTQKHPPKDPRYGNGLDELYQEWRIWKNEDRKRAHTRRPFQHGPVVPYESVVSEQVSEAESAQRIDLAGLDPLLDKKDKEGNTTQKGLLTIYKEKKKAKAPTDEIKHIENQLSGYFEEAKRIHLLDEVDECLRLLYADIRRGVYPADKNRRLTRPEIWKTIKENQALISDLSKTSFEALRINNPDLVQEQLEGVWDVYTERTLDRFSLLLNRGGLIEEASIDGEFSFGGESLEELNQFASSDEQLRKLLPSDEELRAQANGLFSEAGEEDLREREFAKLVTNREKLLRRSIHDREEAAGRYGEDRARYRQMAEESELYWQPTYASYFEVFAKTPEQFQIAVETFTQWIRSGLTKSPNELFQRTRGFIDALTTAGQRERAHVSTDFMVGLRRELEAMVAVLGANHANEHYKGDYFKQFMDFGAADEGPERLVRLSRVARGKVGPLLWKLDNDLRVELLHSPHGSRGQLMKIRNPIEMEELQAQVKKLLIEETMGLEIKDYHPHDPDKRTKAEYQQMIRISEDRLKELKSKSGSKEGIAEVSKTLEDLRRIDCLEDNLEEIANFLTDEEFKNLYEGFDLREQNRLYRELKQRYEQTADSLKPAEKRALVRLERVGRVQRDLANGVDPGELKGEDRRLYQEAKNAVDLALEIYGVIGEKARRGGGVFLADRNTHIEAYQKLKNTDDAVLTQEQKKSKRTAEILMYVRKGRKINESRLNHLPQADRDFFASLKKEDIGDFVDYIPNFWAEKIGHLAQNWVKAEYGGKLDPEIQNKLRLERRAAGEAALGRSGLSSEERRGIEGWMNPKGIMADELQFRVDQARRMIIWAVKTYGHDAKLWDFTLLRDGKAVDPNTLGYVKDSLGVPYGIDHNADNDVRKYRYAVPVNPRILGYNSTGSEVILVFDDEGRPVKGESTGLKFDDQTGKAVIYDQPTKTKNIELQGKTIARERERIKFDNLDINTRARQMSLKTPTGNIDPKTGKMVVVGMEKVPLDFDALVHRFHSHPYSRWTGHPYWGYQEEDTGLILTEDAFKDAEKIKQGLLRPEDAEPHATQLLVVDPTLQRVTHFEDRESREDVVVLAGVEDSYQDEWILLDEFNMAFSAEDADDEYNRIAYVEQDWGGLTKMWINPRAIYARWTDMLGRRGRTMGSRLPVHFSSMPGMHGADGALGELRMMNYGQEGKGGSYRMVGQFALEKWINQTEAVQDVFEALTGYVNPQEKRDREGYLEKPTDDADVILMDHRQEIATLINTTDAPQHENIDIKFMSDVRRTRGRKEIVIQRMRVLETAKRGERAPRWLKGVDIFERNSDGSIKELGGEKVFNGKINEDRDVGSSRHSGTIFFWRDVVWLRSDKPEEGQQTYENVAMYYRLMDLPQIAERRMALEDAKLGKKRVLKSRFEQELSKEVR